MSGLKWTQAPSLKEPILPENLLKDAGLPEIKPQDDTLQTDVRRAQMRRVALSDAIKLAHDIVLLDTHPEKATGYEIPDLLIPKEGSTSANVVTANGFEKPMDQVSLEMLGGFTDEIEMARRDYHKYIADGPGASASDVDPFQRGFMAAVETTFQRTHKLVSELVSKSEDAKGDKRRKIVEDYVTNLGERAVISHKISYNSITDLLHDKKKTPKSLIYDKQTDEIIQKFREVAIHPDPRERSWFNLATKLGYKMNKDKGQANKKFKKLVEVCKMLCLPVEILDKKKKPGPKGRD